MSWEVSTRCSNALMATTLLLFCEDKIAQFFFCAVKIVNMDHVYGCTVSVLVRDFDTVGKYIFKC